MRLIQGNGNYIKTIKIVGKIVKDFSSIILRKRSIAFCVVSVLVVVYACSSAYYDEIPAESWVSLKTGTVVDGTRVVNGRTVHTAVGGTVADYVDLGIMVNGRKVLFATHNLGAYSENDPGARIAWGELGTKEEGYLRGVKSKDGVAHYGDDNYRCSSASNVLASCDDAATVSWGTQWRTPTKAEMLELLMSRDLEHRYTRNGLVITSKVPGCQGNSIFLPYMEDATPGVYEKNDGYAYYMTSETNERGEAECGIIASKGIRHGWITGSHHESRSLGSVIRPVRIAD